MNSIIGVKKEMTQVYNEDGSSIPVTVIDISDVKVANLLNENEVNTHVVIGKGKRVNPNKPETNNYKKLGFVPFFTFVEKLTTADGEVEIGSDLNGDLFKEGEKVKVTGISKGKGFQGVVKRWGFHGGPKTHGQSDKWRSPGSIGSGTTPGRVVKGKKMGGHMGNVTKTVKNLQIVKIDLENKLLLVSGSVPGPKGGYVIIRKEIFNTK